MTTGLPDLPLAEDILMIKNDKPLWIAIAVLGVVIIIGLALFLCKRSIDTLHGYLKLGQKFINVGDVVVEGFNFYYLVLEPFPSSLWTKKYLPDEGFFLQTEIDGQLYAMMSNYHKFDLPQDIVSLCPVGESAELLLFSKESSVALEFDEKGVLFWNDQAPKEKFKIVSP